MNMKTKKQEISINILVLASSKLNSININNEYPLCLTEVDGASVLEHIVRNTSSIANSQYAFTFLETDAIAFHLEKIAKLLVPDSQCTRVQELSQGSACTALLATCQLEQEAELLIISANEIVDLDLSKVIQDFRSRELDAGTLTFRSVHPRYSYVRLDNEGFVTEAAQRKPISLFATVGIFWFSKTAFFVEGAKKIIQKDAQIDGSYFIAPTFNEMVLNQKKIGVKEIDNSKYIPLKTDKLVEQFEGSKLA